MASRKYQTLNGTRAWDAVKQTGGTIKNKVGNSYQSVREKVSGTTPRSAWKTLSHGTSTVSKGVQKTMNNTWDMASRQYRSLNGTQTWDTVKQTGSTIKNKVGNSYQSVREKVSGTTSRSAWNGVQKTMNNTWNAASSEYASFNGTQTWDAVKQTGSTMKHKAGNSYEAVRKRVARAPPSETAQSTEQSSSITSSRYVAIGIGAVVAAVLLAVVAGGDNFHPNDALEVEMHSGLMSGEAQRQHVHTAYEPIVDTTDI